MTTDPGSEFISLNDHQKAVCLIDVSNIYYTAKFSMDGKVDYSTLLAFLRSEADLERVIAYGSEAPEAESFKKVLENLGVELKYKKPKIYADGGCKSDWDVGIALDVARIISDYDVFILGSADSDFAPLVEFIHEHGKQCWVFGICVSEELHNTADRVFTIPEALILGAR